MKDQDYTRDFFEGLGWKYDEKHNMYIAPIDTLLPNAHSNKVAGQMLPTIANQIAKEVQRREIKARIEELEDVINIES